MFCTYFPDYLKVLGKSLLFTKYKIYESCLIRDHISNQKTQLNILIQFKIVNVKLCLKIDVDV
jgi:hypothetical protein